MASAFARLYYPPGYLNGVLVGVNLKLAPMSLDGDLLLPLLAGVPIFGALVCAVCVAMGVDIVFRARQRLLRYRAVAHRCPLSLGGENDLCLVQTPCVRFG